MKGLMGCPLQIDMTWLAIGPVVGATAWILEIAEKPLATPAETEDRPCFSNVSTLDSKQCEVLGVILLSGPAIEISCEAGPTRIETGESSLRLEEKEKLRREISPRRQSAGSSKFNPS